MRYRLSTYSLARQSKAAKVDMRTTRTITPTVMPAMRGTLESDESSEAMTSTVIVGTSSTVTPSAMVASSLVVPMVEVSEVCTWSAVLEAGTAMVAVMRTLAAATLI
eukprot:scaffold124372_cov48-Phaeocystis_antarctica.AAC.1